MGLIVATETSALTSCRFPDSYHSGFTFPGSGTPSAHRRLFLLLPAYFEGELSTAYQLLEKRFGAFTRRATSPLHDHA
jgi:hypothetical protein